MTVEDPGRDPESLGDQRLTSLDERLKAIQQAEQVRTGTAQKKPDKGYSQGNRVLTELIAGLAGGGLMGWLFDSWLGTSPGFLLGFLFLGIGVAFRNIIRISQERPK
jgi:ATP synthase protein I